MQLVFRDELERNLDQGKKKQKAKKLMLMINCIKEFKTISKEPELRYRAIQILSTILYMQEISELNITSTSSGEWNSIFKFRKEGESATEIRLNVIDHQVK
jgi:hypothetical protein